MTMRRWTGSAIFVVFGTAALVLSLAWNHGTDGWWIFGLSTIFAVVLAAGGRSDLLRTFRGDADERGARVTEVTSNIVLNMIAAVAVAGSLVEQARGVHQGPWTLACVAGGALYLVTFLTVRALT